MLAFYIPFGTLDLFIVATLTPFVLLMMLFYTHSRPNLLGVSNSVTGKDSAGIQRQAYDLVSESHLVIYYGYPNTVVSCLTSAAWP